MNTGELLKNIASLAALIIILWLGGNLLEEFIGRIGRAIFEFFLILIYAIIVLKFRIPIPFLKKKKEDNDINS
tara:strand:- start:225 stop:443 length:219 start_codon:yes stop_codon:yes gene_type:complete